MYLNMKILAALLLSAALANCQMMNTCPSNSSIYPCQCKIGTDSRSSVTCRNIRSTTQLGPVTKGMAGRTVTYFRLENSNISILPSDMFHDLEILSLAIVDSNLTKLTENRNRPAFAGLESSLEILDIRNVFKPESGALTTLSLSHLKKLTNIHLENNFIPTIGNDWFESGPYTLRDVHFYRSNTSTVGSHAFEALDNMRTFTLSGGQITEVSRDMLPAPALLLERLDLSSNRLNSLPHDIFVKMPVLEALYLGNNLLTTIDEITFAPIWSKLVYVNFEGNPIKCDSNIKWIYKYRTPENFRGRCAEPMKLRNRDFTSLTIADFE